MNKEKANISLEILILNDLLRTKVKDQTIYNQAIQMLKSTQKAA